MTDASSIEELALELLRIDSVTGHETAIVDHIQARLAACGPDQLVRAGDNLAIVPQALRAKRPRLMLLGHVDTVPASGDNPPRLAGDKLYGLGASDMKGADAVMIDLCERACRTAPDELPFDLAFVLYAREEGPFEQSGMPEVLAAAPDLFEGIDLAIAMEPTDNHIELGCLGTLHACVRFEGQRAHSARPWQGRNALHAAGPLLTALAALAPRDVTRDGLTFREVCSATMCAYEGARNVIPGSCSINVNFRFGPDRTPDEAKAWLRDFVSQHAGEGAHTSFTDVCPSGRVCGDNPLVGQLAAIAGPTTTRRAKQAWTDVGRLSAMGLDAVNFGPGQGAQAHQVGEWCSRPALARSHRILSRWLFG